MSSKPSQAVPGPLHHAVCELYTPGHQVHSINLKLGWKGTRPERRGRTILTASAATELHNRVKP